MNENHDELGRFCKAEDASSKKEDWSSSAVKLQYLLDVKKWDDLKHLEISPGVFKDKRDEWIDVCFSEPLIESMFYPQIMANTPYKECWAPKDYDQKYDMLGVDAVFEDETGQQYPVDFKVITSNFGSATNVDLDNPTFNLSLFSADNRGRIKKEWFYNPDSLTKMYGFTSIRTGYTKQGIFQMSQMPQTKAKNLFAGASFFLTDKKEIKRYLNGFGDEDLFQDEFEAMIKRCKETGEDRVEKEIKNPFSGDTLTYVVHLSKDGYHMSLNIKGQTLKQKCKARAFFC